MEKNWLIISYVEIGYLVVGIDWILRNEVKACISGFQTKKEWVLDLEQEKRYCENSWCRLKLKLPVDVNSALDDVK